MEYDDFLGEVGDYGMFQTYLIWLILVPAMIPYTVVAFTQVFMVGIPRHWCKVPALGNNTIRQHLSIPLKESGEFEKCIMYDLDYDDLINNNPQGNWTIDPNSAVTSCQSGWEYNLSYYAKTITTDWDLVCNWDVMPFVSLVAVLAGMPVGLAIFDKVENRFGRRMVFFGCITIQIVVGLISAWCPEVFSYCLARFIVGFSFPVSHKIVLIYGLEFIGEIHRNWFLFIMGICHCMGYMIVALVVHIFRDWQHMTYVTTLPFLVYYLYFWWLPESPRYLVSQGLHEEALDVYSFIGDMNGKPLSPEKRAFLKEEITKLHGPLKPPAKTFACLDLWSGSYATSRTICFIIVWFCNAVTYLGLTCFITDLGGSPTLNFFLGALVEIPAFWATLIMKDHLDRRIMVGGWMIIGGIAGVCIWWTFGNVYLSVGLCMFAKFCVTISLAVIAQFGGSGNPKVPAGIYLDLAGNVIHFALCLVPLIIYSIFYVYLAPMMTFAVSQIVAGILTFFLPKSLKPIYRRDASGNVIPEDLDLNWKLCFKVPNSIEQYERIPLKEPQNEKGMSDEHFSLKEPQSEKAMSDEHISLTEPQNEKDTPVFV